MNKISIAPFVTLILLLAFDLVALIQAIIQRENGRVTLAGIAFIGIIGLLYYMLLCHNTKRLKPVRVRSRR